MPKQLSCTLLAVLLSAGSLWSATLEPRRQYLDRLQQILPSVPSFNSWLDNTQELPPDIPLLEEIHPRHALQSDGGRPRSSFGEKGSRTASRAARGMISSRRARNFSRRVIFFLSANSAGEKLVWGVTPLSLGNDAGIVIISWKMGGLNQRFLGSVLGQIQKRNNETRN